MHAGRRNNPITLQIAVVTQGATGGMVTQWVDASPVLWADAVHLSGNERRASTAGGGMVAQARTEFGIAYRPGVTTQHRVVWQGVTYNIVHVNNVRGRNERLVLTCDTGVNDG